MKSLAFFLTGLFLFGCIKKNPVDPVSDVTRDGSQLTLQVFNDEYIHIDHKTAETVINFPGKDKEFKSIMLEFTLSCPNQTKCDAWDRPGDLHVIQNVGGKEVPIEILRFMTPYGVGGTWKMDVTHLRSLLTDNVKFRLFIKTYVSQGHAQGDGWLVTTKFHMTSGKPENQPVAVVPLWGSESVYYGDPSKEGKRETKVKLPNKDFNKMYVVTTLTGHGQGNAENCAEFCDKLHYVKVNKKSYSTRIWRADCAQNPVNNQKGNWTVSRAGWCPGDIVKPWKQEIDTKGIDGGDQVKIVYEPEPFVNTCRPGVDKCVGCTLGTGCEYDGNRHTESRWLMSSYLVLMK
jgi:hypothetical protein